MYIYFSPMHSYAHVYICIYSRMETTDILVLLFPSIGHVHVLVWSAGIAHQLHLPSANLCWGKITFLHESVYACIIQTQLELIFPNPFHFMYFSQSLHSLRQGLAFHTCGQPREAPNTTSAGKNIFSKWNVPKSITFKKNSCRQLLGSWAFQNTHY